MKRNIVFLLVLLSTWMGWAQSNSSKSFYVYRSDGIVDTFLIAEVDSISFAEPTPIPVASDSALVVDLGLSVKWANHNVGTSSPEGYGGLYGWGDPTGMKTSISYVDYPNSNPPSSICGTNYDIAHVKWGGSWRLPTYAEQTELRTKCTWTPIVYQGVNGHKVVGPNGNSLFLPAAGYRNGTVVSDQGYTGHYWSGTLGGIDSAYDLASGTVGVGGFVGFGNNYRAGGHSVRPVTE